MKQITVWWLAAQQGNQPAKEALREALCGLRWAGSGRHKKRSPEDERDIASACLIWLPICKELNKVFERLWQKPAYQTSERKRKEVRGKLAEQFGIPVADVAAIESYLQKRSRKASKSTPYEAMIRMVAREFPGIGVKTVEKIRQDYLAEHPEKKRRKRSKTATPR